MNELLLEKLDELFLELDNSIEIKEMIELKEKIYKDSNLKKLLDEYRTLDNHDPKIKKIKKEIIEEPHISKYHYLENELYFLVLEINQKFNRLFDKKRCNK